MYAFHQNFATDIVPWKTQQERALVCGLPAADIPLRLLDAAGRPRAGLAIYVLDWIGRESRRLGGETVPEPTGSIYHEQGAAQKGAPAGK